MDTNHVFTYHAPKLEDIAKYEEIRIRAKDLADTIIATTPVCADQSAALRHLRECVMTANAAIALEGRLD